MGLLSITALLIAILSIPDSTSAAPPDGRLIAQEAVNVALALPAGHKRDGVLRAISRNLRRFGYPDEGHRAAVAMSDRGKSEYVETNSGKSLHLPDQHVQACRAGLWREDDGSQATSDTDREAWTKRCVLDGEYHFTALPDVSVVRGAAAALPAGDVKAATLARLISSYGDPSTLDFVEAELDRSPLSSEQRNALRGMLRLPSALYAHGAKAEAITAAQRLNDFPEKATLIVELIRDGDTRSAISVFETIRSAPPQTNDGTCMGWFNPFGGLYLSHLGSAMSPSAGLQGFLDLLYDSPTFREICPNGFDAETAVEYLLAAGRFDMAIKRAEQAPDQPFLSIDALLQSGRATLQSGDRISARKMALRSGAALPAFSGKERPGDTRRRFQVIQLLAATGAISEADSLARGQPAGAMRAIALSVAAAGRAGMRFDEQAPMLSEVDGRNL